MGGGATRSTAGRSATASVSNSPVANSFGTCTAGTCSVRGTPAYRSPPDSHQAVGIQTLGERVHRFHRPEARAPHDDPARPSLAEQIDRVREVLPAAVARLPARAAEPATRTHAPPVEGQDPVPPVGEQGREPEPLGLVADPTLRVSLEHVDESDFV